MAIESMADQFQAEDPESISTSLPTNLPTRDLCLEGSRWPLLRVRMLAVWRSGGMDSLRSVRPRMATSPFNCVENIPVLHRNGETCDTSPRFALSHGLHAYRSGEKQLKRSPPTIVRLLKRQSAPGKSLLNILLKPTENGLRCIGRISVKGLCLKAHTSAVGLV